MTPTRREAYQLLHNGILALAAAERAGIRIDVDRLQRTISKVEREIAKQKRQLESSKFFGVWKKHFREKANLTSRPQLAHILFTVMKHPCEHRTEKGNPQTTPEALDKINHPFVRKFQKLMKLEKAMGTYLKGILRETDDGFLHPAFDLNTPVSYRGASQHPNFQNLPIRDPEFGKLIRSCFISRDGFRLGELDYSGIEVRVAACVSKDPRLIRYITDPTTDMHRDMAAQIYKVPRDQVSKKARYCAKNMFVFPQFYGSYFKQCAPNLWNAISTFDLDVPKWSSYDRFERHVEKVEADFWGNRFKVYGRWKEREWARYQKTGEFDLVTGFRMSGLMKKNQMLNGPIQGPAFHCLLWSLTKLTNWLRRNRMKTVIVGQIHDSIVVDIYRPELKRFLKKAKQVMTVDLRNTWDWIIVPLEIEAEICPVGGSWFDKKEMQIP